MYVNCPHCNQRLDAPAEMLDTDVECPSCSKTFHLPTSEPPPVPSQARPPELPSQRTRDCPFCGESILAVAKKCKHCGEWIDSTDRVSSVSGPDPGIKAVPPWQTVLLLVFTLCIYQLFWLERVFKELHKKGATKTTGGQAVGFLFIPFFNFVWYFIVWAKLGNAIQTAYKQKGQPPPPTGLVWLAPPSLVLAVILNLTVPPAGLIPAYIGLCIVIAMAQSWMNQLASGQFMRMPTAGVPGSLPVSAAARCPECAQAIEPAARVCIRCGYRLSHEEQEAVNREADDALRVMQKEVALVALRRKASTKTWIGWSLIGVAVVFGLGLLTVPFDPQARRELGIAGIVGGFVFWVILPGVGGPYLLKRAAAHKKEIADCASKSATQTSAGSQQTGGIK